MPCYCPHSSGQRWVGLLTIRLAFRLRVDLPGRRPGVWGDLRPRRPTSCI